MTTEAKSPELVEEKSYEVVHYSESDFVINKTSDHARMANQLIPMFRGGPPRWARLNSGVAAGEVDGRTLTYKIKAANPHPLYFNAIGAAREKRRLENSLIKEVKLAAQVKQIIDSPEVQTLVQAQGFNSIRFIPPILGVVYRNGYKVTVYEYASDAGRTPDLSARLPTEQLRAHFIEHGINPEDLDSRHLLIDEAANIALIDAETYRAL